MTEIAFDAAVCSVTVEKKHQLLKLVSGSVIVGEPVVDGDGNHGSKNAEE